MPKCYAGASGCADNWPFRPSTVSPHQSSCRGGVDTRVWAVTPRPVTALVVDAVSFAIAAGREGYRLSRRARPYRYRGVNGLLDEAISYLQWRMSNGEGGDTS